MGTLWEIIAKDRSSQTGFTRCRVDGRAAFSRSTALRHARAITLATGREAFAQRIAS